MKSDNVIRRSGKLESRAREISERVYQELLKAPQHKVGKLLLEVNFLNGGIGNAELQPPKLRV